LSRGISRVIEAGRTGVQPQLMSTDRFRSCR
jgi:hypothetical protein